MFVLYGSGNREDRGTFNVRSDRDVHASAVRANRRRLAEIERRRHAKLVKPARERRTGKDPAKDLALMKMQRETAAWQSEYQKNFPTYELACYRRSLANLTPRPVSAAIWLRERWQSLRHSVTLLAGVDSLRPSDEQVGKGNLKNEVSRFFFAARLKGRNCPMFERCQAASF